MDITAKVERIRLITKAIYEKAHRAERLDRPKAEIDRAYRSAQRAFRKLARVRREARAQGAIL